MRALVISDTHFGTASGRDSLRYPHTLALVEPLLEDVDELVFLGDLFDLPLAPRARALANAGPLLDMLARRLRGRRLVFVPGNHDHPYIRPGASLDINDLLRRRMPEVEVELRYPVYELGGVLLTHGHYLDLHPHPAAATTSRVMAALLRAAVSGREASLTERDYEAAQTILDELLCATAELRDGARLKGAAALARRVGVPIGRGLVRRPAALAVGPKAPVTWSPTERVRGIHQAALDLGWDRRTDKIVFGHTHQPLDGAPSPDGRIRYWNAGSWVGGPGAAVMVDTAAEAPRLLRLEDQ